MTMRWFTDADRRAMREAERARAEACQVLDALRERYGPPRVITEEEKTHQPPALGSLRIDPYRRTLRR